jgi:hypothetical protein
MHVASTSRMSGVQRVDNAETVTFDAVIAAASRGARGSDGKSARANLPVTPTRIEPAKRNGKRAAKRVDPNR